MFQFAKTQLQQLMELLRAGNYQLIGPIVRDGAVVFADIDAAEQMPRGVVDDQSAGSYRLTDTGNDRYFYWVNGPQALKPLLFKPRQALWRVQQTEHGMCFAELAAENPPTQALAVIGARACDLAALSLQDQHFLRSDYPDSHYANQRENLFIVAVDCARSAETCFCASTGDGPRANSDFDLCLTEFDDKFLIRSGSERGNQIIQQLKLQTASAQDQTLAENQSKQCAEMQTRNMPPKLDEKSVKAEQKHWQEVAARCLSCGNCTAVCPTCFCHSEFDELDVQGLVAEHYRQWSSCFTQEHSYMHGITIRDSTNLRYRQWITHKLIYWQSQYGRSGCVGCGRCITWCPVGIDISAEAWQMYIDDAANMGR